MLRVIAVRGIPESYNQTQVHNLFEQYGQIESIKILKQSPTLPKQQVLITYMDPNCAKDARSQMHQRKLDSEYLYVDFYSQPEVQSIVNHDIPQSNSLNLQIIGGLISKSTRVQETQLNGQVGLNHTILYQMKQHNSRLSLHQTHGFQSLGTNSQSDSVVGEKNTQNNGSPVDLEISHILAINTINIKEQKLLADVQSHQRLEEDQDPLNLNKIIANQNISTIANVDGVLPLKVGSPSLMFINHQREMLLNNRPYISNGISSANNGIQERFSTQKGNYNNSQLKESSEFNKYQYEHGSSIVSAQELGNLGKQSSNFRTNNNNNVGYNNNYYQQNSELIQRQPKFNNNVVQNDRRDQYSENKQWETENYKRTADVNSKISSQNTRYSNQGQKQRDLEYKRNNDSSSRSRQHSRSFDSRQRKDNNRRYERSKSPNFKNVYKEASSNNQRVGQSSRKYESSSGNGRQNSRSNTPSDSSRENGSRKQKDRDRDLKSKQKYQSSYKRDQSFSRSRSNRDRQNYQKSSRYNRDQEWRSREKNSQNKDGYHENRRTYSRSDSGSKSRSNYRRNSNKKYQENSDNYRYSSQLRNQKERVDTSRSRSETRNKQINHDISKSRYDESRQNNRQYQNSNVNENRSEYHYKDYIKRETYISKDQVDKYRGNKTNRHGHTDQKLKNYNQNPERTMKNHKNSKSPLSDKASRVSSQSDSRSQSSSRNDGNSSDREFRDQMKIQFGKRYNANNEPVYFVNAEGKKFLIDLVNSDHNENVNQQDSASQLVKENYLPQILGKNDCDVWPTKQIVHENKNLCGGSLTIVDSNITEIRSNSYLSYPLAADSVQNSNLNPGSISQTVELEINQVPILQQTLPSMNFTVSNSTTDVPNLQTNSITNDPATANNRVIANNPVTANNIVTANNPVTAPISVPLISESDQDMQTYTKQMKEAYQKFMKNNKNIVAQQTE